VEGNEAAAASMLNGSVKENSMKEAGISEQGNEPSLLRGNDVVPTGQPKTGSNVALVLEDAIDCVCVCVCVQMCVCMYVCMYVCVFGIFPTETIHEMKAAIYSVS